MKRKKEEETETHFYVRDEQQRRRRFPKDPLLLYSIRLPITLPSLQFEAVLFYTPIHAHTVMHAYSEQP
jgi:hypothetical protein